MRISFLPVENNNFIDILEYVNCGCTSATCIARVAAASVSRLSKDKNKQQFKKKLNTEKTSFPRAQDSKLVDAGVAGLCDCGCTVATCLARAESGDVF